MNTSTTPSPACGAESPRTLAGRRALVTGSTSGIGLGIAEALAAQGAAITLNGFGDPVAIEQQVADLSRRYGVPVSFEAADLSQADEVASLVERSIAAHGGLDILVNNAGIQHVDSIQNFPVDRWDAVIALNLSAVFHGMRAALPDMLGRNWGRIINIASVHGLVASANKSAYVAAKHGVIGLTKAGALETARTGVTVNAICPGWVLTPLVQKQIDARQSAGNLSADEAREALLGEKQPSMAFVTPDQLGAMAVFLCSSAADQIRGASMVLDGGWTAQ